MGDRQRAGAGQTAWSLSPAAIRTYLGLLERLPISLDQPTTVSAWHDTLALARSHRLTSYAAAYLELALRRGLPAVVARSVRRSAPVSPQPPNADGCHDEQVGFGAD